MPRNIRKGRRSQLQRGESLKLYYDLFSLKDANYTEYNVNTLTQDSDKLVLVTRLFLFIFTAASSDCEMATVAET
jgi:hypothetical protein